MKPYKTIVTGVQAEFVEKKSRFIGATQAAHSPEEAADFIAAVKKQHWDARHNVFAYILRDGTARFSDDGEPQGTAGTPVLAVLQKQALCDVVLTVTRYFGGVLLGAGGLTRAYGNAASLAIQAADVVFMKPCSLLQIHCPYPMLKKIEETIGACSGKIERTTYEEAVTIELYLELEKCRVFQEALTEISLGQITAQETGKDYRAFPIKKEEA